MTTDSTERVSNWSGGHFNQTLDDGAQSRLQQKEGSIEPEGHAENFPRASTPSIALPVESSHSCKEEAQAANDDVAMPTERPTGVPHSPRRCPRRWSLPGDVNTHRGASKR